MEDIKKILKESLNIDFVSATISNPRMKKEILRIKIRPIIKKEVLLFQCESFSKTQVFHINLERFQVEDVILEWMKEYRQMQIETREVQYTILISKKGKITSQKKLQKSAKHVELSHNRSKNYIIKEGTRVPFLVDLGVMTDEGKVVKSKSDKFRQVNRFLEFIEDVLPKLSKNREITILDFGCGKSYLTFAMYYYLHELKEYDIRIIGLDLKADVIHRCNQLSEKYQYKKLKFFEGNIADYTGLTAVDMVVTLHACDTATDYALAKAVEWKAEVILSVPCCQHELNGQMQNEILAPLFKYGLIKERMASLVTDAMRAEYLVNAGYEVQILEFIDMEHTPKNILIRALKSGKAGTNEKTIGECEAFFNITPTLGSLLKHKGEQ